MNAWIACALLLSALFLPFSKATAAPRYGDYGDSPQPFDRLRHELRNQSEELRMLAERLNTQEELIEALRSDIQKFAKTSQDAAKSENSGVQARIADLEAKTAALESANTTMATLLDSYRDLFVKYQGKLEGLEASVGQQTKNSKHLEKSLGSLLEAVGGESSAVATADTEIYKVASGDSLEKIARKNRTTIRAIKELNGLDTDRIIIGQKLKIPKVSP